MTGPAGLLEAHPELVGRPPAVDLGLGQVATEHETDDDVERVVVARREQRPSPQGRSLDDGRLLGVDAAAGHEVGAVPVHRDEERLERPTQGGAVLTRKDPADEAHQAVDLGGLDVVDDEPLRRGDDLVQVDEVRSDLGPQAVQGAGLVGRGQDPFDPEQRVVPRGAGAAPRVGQPLLAGSRIFSTSTYASPVELGEPSR